MPHVSRRRVKRKVFVKLNEGLIDTLADLHSRAEFSRLTKDLLTPTERIMLSKRIAIILMLKRGYSFRTIVKTLQVTQQTVVRFWKMLKHGKFSYLKPNKKNSGEKNFLEVLEKIFQANLPPRGKGRWAHVIRATRI